MPAEWEPQAFVQLTWPHEDTDWRDMLPEVTECFVAMARAILRFEPLLVVCRDAETVRRLIAAPQDAPLRFCESASDDTWARDHGGIGRWDGQRLAVCDFGYNAWGAKFPFEKDNAITAALRRAGIFADRDYVDCLDCILEGGSLESDGQGTLLTTESCLLSQHRNDLDKAGAEAMLRDRLGAGRVLWIKHSYLAGDDTDGHIDMLARFCDVGTIAYMAPPESPAPGSDLAPSEREVEERQRASLQALETELLALRQANGLPYRLIALPCPDPVYEEGERLPASYANFLILNGAVLVPVYRVPQDDAALSRLAEAFPGREIVGIDCRVLIRQHGSLHCSTMQYPASGK
ncbi:MAG: agmatine deiminase family protein [Bacteroidales bacterium]|nr:agmatine deiminase family protein [Bacteroidales bacterium]